MQIFSCNYIYILLLDSASKHATQAFFDTLKSELSNTNIHVCLVSPGYVNTNLSLNAVTGDGSRYGGTLNFFILLNFLHS